MIAWADLGVDIGSATSGQVKTTCPACSKTRKKKTDKCLSVNLDDGVAHCHHCGEDFVLSPGSRPTKQYIIPPQAVDLDIPDPLRRYCHQRKISDVTLNRNCIGVARQFFPQIQKEDDCIVFPYFEGGQIVNYKYRTKDKNFAMHSGAKPVLYGINDIVDAEYAIWVEGEFDKLAVEEAGFRNCVSVPNGANVGAMEYLANSEAAILPLQRHILAIDNDEKGRLLRDELARRLDPVKCYYLVYPEGCKDANDVLVKYGADKLRSMIMAPKPFPIEGIIKPDTVEDEVLRIAEHGIEPGVITGWPDLDRHYTIKKGQWSLVTGVPSHGKSTFIDALAINMASLHKWKLAYYSPENFPIEQHIIYLLKKRVGKAFGRDYKGAMSMDEVRSGMAWINKHFTFLNSDETTFNLEKILELTKVSILREGLDGLIIDPWNELDHARPWKLTETEYISQSLTTIRKFARKYEIHVWLVAHPTKPLKDKSNKFQVPTLYDVSGSAHWYNKTDNGLVVYRDIDDPDDMVQVHIQKVRFRDTGKPGMVKLKFDITTGRYS